MPEHAEVDQQRPRTDRGICLANGWTVGTVLRGRETWGNGDGMVTTIRITGLGEETVLARCMKHEPFRADGSAKPDVTCTHRETTWTLKHRDWEAVSTCPGPGSVCRDEADARRWADIINRVAFGYAFECSVGHWHYAGVV